ncbi:MAG: PQQ-dependent sugar dehydrogenase [Rhodanobacteraceae bacterium]
MRASRFWWLTLVAAVTTLVRAQSLPAGFHVGTPIIDRALPTGVYFAHDGRVFVTEKSGLIWVYRNLLDTDPQPLVDLTFNVHDNWDRGLLGFALDPRFPEVPYVYVQYAYNGGLGLGGPMPRWPSCPVGNPICGVNGGTDYCPSPPGDTTPGGGCVISGRVSRLTVNGDTAGDEHVLVEDWYQQFPSHSIGTIKFGPDGFLYAGGGDGASFNFHDFGQSGNPDYPDLRSPLNPDNPNDQATNQGGSLRAQGLEIESVYNAEEHDVWLNGSIIRIDPGTGDGAPGNPLANDPMPNARRIIAYGLRNPFRFTFRPGTDGELWVGDVGESTWEEVDRIPALPDAGSASLINFGWPCYEGRNHHGGFSGPICTALYAAGDTGGRTPFTQPWYTYAHRGGSDITGLAFYEGSSYPTLYSHALFFCDNSRGIIFVIPYVDANGDGIPDAPPDGTTTMDTATPFLADTSVQLASGPGGDVFYVNINSGTIDRISYCNGCTNRAPSAAIALSAGSSGDGAPREIEFSADNSIDPDGDTLTYAWDLDDDGNFGDASGVTAGAFFADNGSHTVAVKADDGQGRNDIARMIVTVTNTAPTVTITAPVVGATWRADESIALTATSFDAEQGSLPDSALAWQIFEEDCVNPDFTDCTETRIATAAGSNTGVTAPDARFPAYLRIVLTGTDNGDLTGTAEVAIYPETVDVTLASDPVGLLLGYRDEPPAAAPFTRTEIVDAGFAVAAPDSQLLAGITYLFQAWSDGGAQGHVARIASAGSATLTASYAPPADIAVDLDDGLATVIRGQTVIWTLQISNHGVNALTGIAVQSVLPNELVDAHWTCTASAGSSCTASGSGAPFDVAGLAVDGEVVYRITATVGAQAVGDLTVSASATIPGGYLNLSPNDDSVSDTDSVDTDTIFRNGFDPAL